MYDEMKDECDASAAAIFATYHVTETHRWLATINCSDISEWKH